MKYLKLFEIKNPNIEYLVFEPSGEIIEIDMGILDIIFDTMAFENLEISWSDKYKMYVSPDRKKRTIIDYIEFYKDNNIQITESVFNDEDFDWEEEEEELDTCDHELELFSKLEGRRKLKMVWYIRCKKCGKKVYRIISDKTPNPEDFSSWLKENKEDINFDDMD